MSAQAQSCSHTWLTYSNRAVPPESRIWNTGPLAVEPAPRVSLTSPPVTADPAMMLTSPPRLVVPVAAPARSCTLPPTPLFTVVPPAPKSTSPPSALVVVPTATVIPPGIPVVSAVVSDSSVVDSTLIAAPDEVMATAPLSFHPITIMNICTTCIS